MTLTHTRLIALAALCLLSLSACTTAPDAAPAVRNLDIASRFTDAASGRVDPARVLALAGMYVQRAHDEGLPIGQKNAAEMADSGRREIHR